MKQKEMPIVACRLAVVARHRVNFNASCRCNGTDVWARRSFSSMTRTELETQSKTASRSSGYLKALLVSGCISQAGPFNFSEALDREPQANTRGSSSLAYQGSMLPFIVKARSRMRSCRLSGHIDQGLIAFGNSESKSGMSIRRSQDLARKERLGGRRAIDDAAGF